MPRARNPKTPARKGAPAIPAVWGWALLAAVLALVALARARMLPLPLERDEGEYAYAGQLLLQGVPPYSLAYNMKLPGVYAAYALVLALFGQSPSAVHLGLLCANAAAIVLVYLLARRLFGTFGAIASAASYAVLSTSESVLGFAAHATHFVIVPALGGALLLLHAEERSRRWALFLSGALFGLAFVVKQHGAVFVLFGAAYVLSARLRGSRDPWARLFARAGILLAGAALPFALTCLWLLGAGVFDRFWFWTFSYAREYASEVPRSEAWRNFSFMFPRVAGPAAGLWLLGALGLVLLWNGRTRAQSWFATLFVLFAFLGTCPGYYWREHYFVLMLPALAVLDGAAASRIADLFASRRGSTAVSYAAPTALLLLALATSLVAQREVLFERSPMQVFRKIYGLNPFPEAITIGRYIQSRSGAAARIAVLGSEPEIYFYAHRRSATGYIYTYGLMEPQRYASHMQDEMIREIERIRPEYLVFLDVRASWLVQPGSDPRLLEWYRRYRREHYDLTGVVDIYPDRPPVYRWDADAARYTPHGIRGVYVYRRREGV